MNKDTNNTNSKNQLLNGLDAISEIKTGAFDINQTRLLQNDFDIVSNNGGGIFKSYQLGDGHNESLLSS